MIKINNLCDSHISRNSDLSNDVRLWAAKLHVMTMDALIPFKIPGQFTPTLQVQYEKLMATRHKKAHNTISLWKPPLHENAKWRLSYGPSENLIGSALYFFESENLDFCLECIGRERQVNEVFAFIREAVVLRKRYNIACIKDKMKREGIKMSDLKDDTKAYIRSIK